MKHCPKCREEYQDSAFKCAECGSGLAQGGLPLEADPPLPAGASQQRPADSDVILTAPPEYAQPVAFALSKAGIPALVFDCLEPTEGVDGPLQDVLVPSQMYNAALWFCKGFEAGAWPREDEEGRISGPGRDPV